MTYLDMLEVIDSLMMLIFMMPTTSDFMTLLAAIDSGITSKNEPEPLFLKVEVTILGEGFTLTIKRTGSSHTLALGAVRDCGS
jgi:hypothetical protein